MNCENKEKIEKKLKNSNCDKNQNDQIVTKLKNSNCDGSNSDSSGSSSGDSSKMTYFSKNNLTP